MVVSPSAWTKQHFDVYAIACLPLLSLTCFRDVYHSILEVDCYRRQAKIKSANCCRPGLDMRRSIDVLFELFIARCLASHTLDGVPPVKPNLAERLGQVGL